MSALACVSFIHVVESVSFYDWHLTECKMAFFHTLLTYWQTTIHFQRRNDNLFAMDYWQILHVVVPDVSKAESYQFLNIAKASCARMPAGRLVHAFSFHINACVLLRRDKTLKMTQGKTKRNVEIWRVQAMPCHNGHHWFNMYLKQMHAFSVILNDFYERTIKTW